MENNLYSNKNIFEDVNLINKQKEQKKKIRKGKKR